MGWQNSAQWRLSLKNLEFQNLVNRPTNCWHYSSTILAVHEPCQQQFFSRHSGWLWKHGIFPSFCWILQMSSASFIPLCWGISNCNAFFRANEKSLGPFKKLFPTVGDFLFIIFYPYWLNGKKLVWLQLLRTIKVSINRARKKSTRTSQKCDFIRGSKCPSR